MFICAKSKIDLNLTCFIENIKIGAGHSNGASDFIHEAQEALWMVDEGISKGQGQRKRRPERESCINNVKLNVNLTSTKDYKRHIHQPTSTSSILDRTTYKKHLKDKFQRGSLENVSSNPWGKQLHFDEEQSSLRRSRSLAITRQDIFTTNKSETEVEQSGSHHIRPIRRSQLIPRAKLIEKTTRDQRFSSRVSSVENLQNPDRFRRKSSLTPSSDYSLTLETNNSEILRPKFIIGNNDRSIDTERSYYYHNNTKIPYRTSYEDLPELSLPNYYPDSKYDTDNTTTVDNISLTDNISTESCRSIIKEKYSSCDNISINTKWTTINEQESISYDENIVLSTNRPLYDPIRDKPKTIRNHTPFNKDFKENQQLIDEENCDYYEIDRNFDEIKLNNEHISIRIETEETQSTKNNTISQYSNIETNPLYEKIPEQLDEQKQEQTEKRNTRDTRNDSIKTLIEIETNTEINEEYKTIVHVDSELKSELEQEKEQNKQHSHNYLKEFLETQKGSKKPLQNFITKKLTNLSRKTWKDSNTNLVENRFHSLPDITASKNLRKCEKIDRKLRKIVKSNDNRFIVNIGKHFDLSETNINNFPVDFEVKIAKIPKKKNKKNKTEDRHKLEENKPEIIAVTTKKSEPQEMDPLNKKEFQDKLGTMRTYWDRMIHGTKQIEEEEPEQKCKVVEVQTKVEDVKKKFEPQQDKTIIEKPNKVQIVKQIFEGKSSENKEKIEKISPVIKETCNYFENQQNNGQFESLNASIVEIVDKEDENIRKTNKPYKPVSKSKSIAYPEFDHVRYRVVKSDLFQKRIFANCEKESQFDGLMQYLQDYSFQELLIDNNIVIIEPIRTKVLHETTNNTKTTKPSFCSKIRINNEEPNNLKRHFFYHPIRVNKEVNDDELPNPDKVKQVRQFFECGLKRSKSSQNLNDLTTQIQSTKDPDKDHCSITTDSNTSDENLYDSITEYNDEQFVSEDILKKIRECGTTVTYYGGRVVKNQNGQSDITNLIMEEIKNNEKQNTISNKSNNNINDKKDGIYQGVKFKLVKSNSCSSRLELVGTNNINKFKQKIKEEDEIDKNTKSKLDTINASIKVNSNIINNGIEEKKMIQWGEINNNKKTYTGINFNNKKKITYNYHNYDKLFNNRKTRKIDDMEFEPYEVA